MAEANQHSRGVPNQRVHFQGGVYINVEAYDNLVEQNERLTQNIIDCNERSRNLAEKVIGLEEQVQTDAQAYRELNELLDQAIDREKGLEEQLEALRNVATAASVFESSFQRSLGSASAYDIEIRNEAQAKLRMALNAWDGSNPAKERNDG